MLVRLWAASGFTNRRLARRLGVICHADESPTATFSIRSSSANSIVDWIPALPTIRTIWLASYATERMRLSVAATAAVQLRSANATTLNLRIIAPSLLKRCWKHRRCGGEDNEAGSARPLDPQEPELAPVPAATRGEPLPELAIDCWTSPDLRPCCGRGRKRRRSS